MNARWLDMLIVPLVGFDGRGRRLGMGGGFYDATLAFLRRRRIWKKPYLIGLAFECQRVTEIPSEPWDIRLNAILTEKEFFRFSTQ
jgi:5-formyltetrahydrofolate cyclo-ligase